MRDLVRLYASGHVLGDRPEYYQDTALRRLADFYLHTAFAAERVLDPHRLSIAIGTPVSGDAPRSPADGAAALAWLAAEYACLLAVQQLATERGWHDVVLHMARLGFGVACARSGHPGAAVGHLRRAVSLARRIGDHRRLAVAHSVLTWPWGQLARLAHAERSRNLFHTLGDPVWEGRSANTVAWYASQLGRHDQARVAGEAALALSRRSDDPLGQADILDTLGTIAHRASQHTQALAIYRDLDNVDAEAEVLTNLGQTYTAVDAHRQARAAWQNALELYEAQHRTSDAEQVRKLLATEPTARGS
ncbi:hypothetical protein EV192_1021030 [Actinocrispum wychmicini]|uniref:Uncharacterized protein n=1 Tax=Actinocrispum wychmicini TaxID=1213861 RepID=A0A4V2S896_9PSEU|nr:hypothetical protein EV192_1021030 [Actinocrispum wychmicini]